MLMKRTMAKMRATANGSDRESQEGFWWFHKPVKSIRPSLE